MNEQALKDKGRNRREIEMHGLNANFAWVTARQRHLATVTRNNSWFFKNLRSHTGEMGVCVCNGTRQVSRTHATHGDEIRRLKQKHSVGFSLRNKNDSRTFYLLSFCHPTHSRIFLYRHNGKLLGTFHLGWYRFFLVRYSYTQHIFNLRHCTNPRYNRLYPPASDLLTCQC